MQNQYRYIEIEIPKSNKIDNAPKQFSSIKKFEWLQENDVRINTLSPRVRFLHKNPLSRENLVVVI